MAAGGASRPTPGCSRQGRGHGFLTTPPPSGIPSDWLGARLASLASQPPPTGADTAPLIWEDWRGRQVHRAQDHHNGV
ncbi:hypothetical protein E2C01_101734 [Portunus trituberculatus]|uniref:Uncharacterized protein n=1 Tax=Portunus trituberculatus TaxID=210409 RepID=A0A5B7KL34_PORTR|nr:hypothetical protein [Portunus trituberculatus]